MASLITGIAGYVTCPLVLHIVAIVLGNQALGRIRSDPSLEGDGMAKAGVILGWIGVLIGAAFLVFAILFAMGAFLSASSG